MIVPDQIAVQHQMASISEPAAVTVNQLAIVEYRRERDEVSLDVPNGDYASG